VLKPALSSKRRSVHILRARESRHAGSWNQNLWVQSAAAPFRHKLEPGVAKNEVVALGISQPIKLILVQTQGLISLVLFSLPHSPQDLSPS
jgi:hypothetical protein